MASTLTEIREALARTIENGVETSVNVYSQVADAGELPAVIIEPAKADFEGAFQRGLDNWIFNLYVLVPHVDASASQDMLDVLIIGSGESSIRQAVYNQPDLGLTGPDDSDVDAEVFEVTAYGGMFEWAKIPHIGAILKVRVRVS